MSNIFTRLLLNVDGFDKNLFKAQKKLKGFYATSQGIFGGLTKFTGYAAAFVGVSTSIHSAVTANMEFEKSLSSLRALTGVSADELNYFRTEAIRMGMDSTQSASQMVDAFKLIGSQMPELLKNKTALTQTAEAAVVLAEAAELDVPTAAKALTGALNQMGASSAEATDYINILAAASQQGSADIPYLNKAIENAGGAASSTGVKFNELVAIIEAIAPKITDAASAGTNLRNIFLTLESSSDQNLRPSVVGLSKAIDNLSKKNLDAVQLTKMFGKESVTAAIAILQEKDTFDSLSKSIQGTNTAYDQARINNDNLAGSVGKLQSSWTSFINTLAGSNGIIKDVVDSLRTAVNWATRALMTSEEGRKSDLDKKYKRQAEAVLKNSNEWIEQDISLNKKDREKAIQDEISALGRMYPNALKYEKILANYEKEKASYEEAWTAEKALSLNKAKEQFNIAEREKYIYDYVLNNLRSQVTVLEEKSKLEKESKALPNTAAETENLRKQSWIAESNVNGWLKEKMEDRGKFSLPPGSLPIVEIPAIINEEEIEEQLPQTPLEIKLKAKLVDLEFAKEKITELNQMMSVANPEEQQELQKQIKQYESYAGIQIDKNKEFAESFDMVNSAIMQMNGLFSSGSDNMLQYFSNIIQGATKAALAIMALIPIKKQEANANMEAAVSGVASSVGSIPIAGPMLAIGAIASLVAAISAVPKFADGGIVPGSSYFGDKLLARVNSGEMILNQRQQRNLYGLVDNSSMGVSINIDKVRGSDIYLSLKNYMKQTGKKL